MKRKKWSIVKLLAGFVNRVSGDHVGAYATQSAYFLILSFIPCILFLTTLVRYTPLTYNVVRDAIIAFIPENLQSSVLGIVVDVYKRSTAIVPLSALVALWSAGKGLQSIINGLNTIYHVKETRNWLLTRIYAVFYTLSSGDCAGRHIPADAGTGKRDSQKACIQISTRFSRRLLGRDPGSEGAAGIRGVVSGLSACCTKFCRTGKQLLKARFRAH